MSPDENTELAAAVEAAGGALPLPAGPEPQALSDERLDVLRKLRSHCEADRFESEGERPLHVWGPSQYPKREMCQRCTVSREWAEDADADEVVLVAEVDRLRARVAGLEAQRERRRVRLVALQNDALSMRGSLSPMGEDRKVPFPLGETLTPAVDWLIARVAELEAGPALPWAHVMSDGDLREFLGDLVSAALGRWRSEPEVPDRVVLADIEKVCTDWRMPGQGLRSDEPEVPGPDAVMVSPPLALYGERAAAESDSGRRAAWRMLAADVPDGEHYEAVHHSYTVGHDLDLPGTGGDGRG